MRRIFLACAVLAAVLAGCGGGGGSSSSLPTPPPTAPPSPLVMTYVNIPYQPSPYPTTASQILFPFTGSPFAVTVQANGGTPAYNFSTSSTCGTGSNANVTVAKSGTNQFTITPTTFGGGPCTITFTDSSSPMQTFITNAYVNGGG